MRHKVLVAENDAATLALMREVFALHGISVRVADQAADMAHLINSEKFDAVFMDLAIREIDGFDLIRRIRQSSWNRNTPIVVIPERHGTRTRLEAFRAGGTLFLEKPLDRALFTRLLRSTRGVIAEERRRYMRVPFRTKVGCTATGHQLFVTSVNISREGILFEGAGFLRKGHAVALSMPLVPSKPAVCARGVVVRVEEQERAAVRFVPAGSDDAQRLRDFIARQIEEL